YALPFERVLEHLRRALEAGANRDRQTEFALDLFDRIDRLPERIAGREVERDGHRGLIALVIDLQRANRGHDTGDRRERDRRPGRDAGAVYAGPRPGPGSGSAGHIGLHEDVLQLRGVGLKLRLALENDLIIVGRRVDARHLARTEGVEQFLANLV